MIKVSKFKNPVHHSDTIMMTGLFFPTEQINNNK